MSSANVFFLYWPADLLEINLNLFCFFSEQAEARRAKNKESRKRREERLALKRAEVLRKISESEKVEETAQKPAEEWIWSVLYTAILFVLL